MVAIIVLINGVEHNLDDNYQERIVKREKIFAHYFPDAVVKSFDSCKQGDLIDDSYLHRTAENVLDQLGDLRTEVSEESRYLIFVGHNIGASLIKQVLFLASDHETHQWIYWGTLALYLFECPSHLNYDGWEKFLANLLTTGRLPFANLPTIVNFLPKSLVHIEQQFSEIRGLFNVEIINPESGGEIFHRDNDPWNFQDDLARFDAVFMGLSESVSKYKRGSIQGLQEFQRLLAGPDTAMSRVEPTEDPEFLPNWPDESNNLNYNLWLESSGSSVLVLTGQAGSGNTQLSSNILHQNLMWRSRREQVCLSFDFSRPDTRSTSERSLVASLVLQMLAQRPGSWRYIHKQYGFRSSILTNMLLSKQMWKILGYLLSLEPEKPHIFIALNAVDQCREPVASKVARLTAIPGLRASLKVLMTSSTKLSISSSVSLHRVDLEGTGYENAIRATARRRIDHIVDSRPVWRESKKAILESVCSGHFTYLSVMMSLHILEKETLPLTKEALSRHLLKHVVSLESSIRTLTFNIRENQQKWEAINWIYHAIRPLNASELSISLALGPNGVSEASANIPTMEDLTQRVSWDILKDLDDLVGGIIKITESRVLVIPRKVRELLSQEKGVLLADFDTRIVRQCLIYLGLACKPVEGESVSETGSKDREMLCPVPETALLNYAQLYWAEHYKRQAAATDAMDDEVLQFLIDNSDAARSWAARYASLHGWLPDTKETPLLVATQLHFDRLVFKMLEADPQDLSSKLREAARVAAHAGHADLLARLLGKAEGGEVDVLPALCAAATSGQATAVDVLFNYLRLHDALRRLEAAGSAEDMNPVLLAVSRGNTAVVQRILSVYGSFSITARDKGGRTAVHIASGNGDIETLRILQHLRKDEFNSILLPEKMDGADERNLPGDLEGSDQAESEPDESRDSAISVLTPVQMACTSGNLDVFDFLHNILQGNFDQVEDDCSYLLKLAVKAGSLEIVERLFQGDFNLQNGVLEGTLLSDAAHIGHFEMVCLLHEEMSKRNKMQTEQLPKETEDDAEDSDEDNTSGDTFTYFVSNALREACSNGYVDIIEFLLDTTQKRYIVGGDLFKSAARSGHLDVMKTLLSQGYKIQSTEKGYISIMDLAIGYDNAHLVRFLVEIGIKSQWDDDESSIHFAARRNGALCLRELLRTHGVSEITRLTTQGRSALDEAARAGSAETLEDLLDWEKKEETSLAPRNLNTIELALESWDINIRVIRMLLEHGWESDRTDTADQNSALHVAAKEFDVRDMDCQEIFSLLLDYKESTNVDVVNRDGETPLFVACQKGNDGVVSLLLARGADQTLVNKQKRTPLHVALHEKKSSVAIVLLGFHQRRQSQSKPSSTAPVEATDEDGFRPIHLAYWSYDVMEALLDHNPKPDVDAFTLDENSLTALMEAASRGPFRVMQLLLEHGAQVNLKDAFGWTALHIAVERSSDFGDAIEVARHLREHGADVNSRNEAGITALYLAIRHNTDDSDVAMSLLDAIVEDGQTISEAADPNLFGGSYHSPLQLAVSEKSTELVMKLLDRGAQICAEGGAYGSPLHAAMWSDSPDLAKLLLERCILRNQETSAVFENGLAKSTTCNSCGRLNTKPMGTPLHALCSRPQDRSWPTKETASLLVQHGADVNARDYSGRTALMLLAIYRNDDHQGAESLIQDLDANPNLIDEGGKTSLHHAVPRASIDFVRTLLDGKADVQALDGLCQTVLSRAASRNEADMFKTVLERIPEDLRAEHMADALIPSLKSEDPEKTAFYTIMKCEDVDLTGRDRSGWTAMDVATALGLRKEAEILKEKGVKASEAVLRPSKLSSVDKEPIICVSEDGKEAWMQEFDNSWPPRKVVGIVRADHCIPFHDEVYYFEVTVQNVDVDGAISIGLVEGNTPLRSLVGWESTSWGLHSDDGSIMAENEGEDGSTFGDGQIVGVTVYSENNEKSVFFALDGTRVGKLDYTVSGQLFPAVSFLQGKGDRCKARINFGPQDGGEEFTYKPFGGLREEAADQAEDKDEDEENEASDAAESG